MSNFSQIITSFERTGNFPIEANYIFSTVEDLKEFYSDELQAATLHKGLLKIVENNGNDQQALYWVTKKATNDELEFTELITGDNIDEIYSQLDSLQSQLSTEITERKSAVTALWGVNDPSSVTEGYNSINDLATAVQILESKHEDLEEDSNTTDSNLNSDIQSIIGTVQSATSNVEEYLNDLPFGTITEISAALDNIINGVDDSTDAIDTIKELTAFLDGYTNADTLKEIINALWLDIQGSPLPSEEFRTLRGFEDFLIKYCSTNDADKGNITKEINDIEAGIGLNADGSYSADGETYYLQDATSVMNALKLLDSQLHYYISHHDHQVKNHLDDQAEPVILEIVEEANAQVLSAYLKLSTQSGNQLVKSSDGLYSKVNLGYDNGTLTLYGSNEEIVSQHYVGMSAIVKEASYDATNEQLVFTFKLDSGDTQEVTIPVGALIREWEVSNSDTSPIVLTKQENQVGTDKLSADVNISDKSFNILERDGNALYVGGTADNILYGTVQLSSYLASQEESQAEIVKDIYDQIQTANQSISTLNTDLTTEVTNRTSEIARLDKELAAAVSDITTNTNLNYATKAELIEESARAQVAEHDLANAIENVPVYTITKQSTPSDGCTATYLLMKDDQAQEVKIDIPDIAVASIGISDIEDNILEKDTTGLYVIGSASNIKTESGLTVEEAIAELKELVGTLWNNIQDDTLWGTEAEWQDVDSEETDSETSDAEDAEDSGEDVEDTEGEDTEDGDLETETPDTEDGDTDDGNTDDGDTDGVELKTEDLEGADSEDSEDLNNTVEE